jgi:hypothetical protein
LVTVDAPSTVKLDRSQAGMEPAAAGAQASATKIDSVALDFFKRDTIVSGLYDVGKRLIFIILWGSEYFKILFTIIYYVFIKLHALT